MKILAKKIINLPVFTKSNTYLGKVANFSIDINIQSVAEYQIKPESILTGLVKGKLIINRGQVIDISDKKIIVDDNVVSESEKSNFSLNKKEAPREAFLTKNTN
ncbi:MAG TPA: PRC-barrel domain-containing protein [bacterium]|nr:PRC-barrel domain-containing protein [bacterium]HPL95712.1 PRC-barrel domain-containing protein [bacterium]